MERLAQQRQPGSDDRRELGGALARHRPGAGGGAGRGTSRLLNYLDPSIDVSLGDVFGVPSLREAYFGFGVTHRSGIFGSSQLFGNVDGGSNYIYTYLEWPL